MTTHDNRTSDESYNNKVLDMINDVRDELIWIFDEEKSTNSMKLTNIMKLERQVNELFMCHICWHMRIRQYCIN